MSKPRTSNATIIRTPFTKDRRGPFTLRLPTGQRLKFKDALHRGAAWERLSNGRFMNLGVLAEVARGTPRGYITFIDLDAARK